MSCVFKVTSISLDSRFLASDDSAAVLGSWRVEGGDRLVKHSRRQPSKSASPERETDTGESCRPTALAHLSPKIKWLSPKIKS